jgi:hypothetical protein
VMPQHGALIILFNCNFFMIQAKGSTVFFGGVGVIRRPPTGRQANWSALSTGRQG